MNDYSDRAATESPRETGGVALGTHWETDPHHEPDADALVTELVSTPHDPERRGKSTLYYMVAMYWLDLGFNAIPGKLNKTPLVSFASQCHACC